MRRGITPSLTFFAAILMAAPLPAQFPGEVPQNAAPTTTPSGAPGNMDLNAIDRQAPAFQADATALPAPVVVTSPSGASVSLPPSLLGPRAMPGFGYIHQFGAFQINTTTAEGMFMLSANLPFPDGRRSVDFYHARLSYVGKYTDPGTGISGYVYETQVGGPVNDKRFFLFGDQNLNIADGDSNGIRWIVYYNGQGNRTYATTARFYRP